MNEWPTESVLALQKRGVIRVEDGNHGEYRPRSHEFVENGTAFIRAADMDGGRVLFDKASKINETAKARITKGVGAPGDVLISHKGTIGKVARAPIDAPEFVCSPQTTFWRSTNEAELNQDFLYAMMSSPTFQAIFAVRSGETDMAGYVSLTSQRQLQVPLPPIGVQLDIASITSALDDKMELNQRMNETLEEMARAIFKDWFVDFGPTRRKRDGATDPVSILGGLLPDPAKAEPVAALFLDSFGDDGLPIGWEAKALGDVVEPRKGRSITKKTIIPGEVPVVAGGLNPAYFHNKPNVSGPVITTSASGANAGFVRLYNQDIWASDCSYISKEQTDHLFTFYALFSSRQDEIYSMQQGAAQPHIYPSDLKRLTISDAPGVVWEASESLLAPMFELIANNEQENQTLAATRDLLLPKLMSGEIRLKDVMDAL